MKFKQLLGGITVAGALSAAALGVGAGAANAAPGAPPPGPAGNHGGPAPGGIHPPNAPGDPGGPGGPRRAQVARADLRVGPVGRADLRVGPVGRADPVIRAGLRADRAGPIIQADPVGPAVPVDRAVPAARGTEMRSVVTSAGPRGVTGRHLGDPVRRRDPTGTGRSPRLVGTGDMGRSTTGATRRLPCGIPDSTSGASGSSESGFRCKQQ